MNRPDFLVIYRTDTMEVTSIVDPDFEWETNDPAWTKHDQVELKTFRMNRDGFADQIEYNNWSALIAKAQAMLRLLQWPHK